MTKKVLSRQRKSRERSTSKKRSSSINSIRSTVSNVTMNSLTQEANMDVNETDTSDGSNSENIESSAGNSKNKSCRHLFKIVSSSNNQHGTCNLCNENIKMASNSVANLRTHLAYKHDQIDYLTPSQLKVWNQRKNKIPEKDEIKLTKDQKVQLNEKLVDAIIEDSRTFNDFAKNGIKKVFSFLIPGYKPPCKKTIRRMIKKM